jgi:hypothetical protein
MQDCYLRLIHDLHFFKHILESYLVSKKLYFKKLRLFDPEDGGQLVPLKYQAFLNCIALQPFIAITM